jgi:hypothetical protein
MTRRPPEVEWRDGPHQGPEESYGDEGGKGPFLKLKNTACLLDIF